MDIIVKLTATNMLDETYAVRVVKETTNSE